MTDKFNEGIVTLADSDFFPGLILLYQSVQESYPVPIICFDAGLERDQRKWVDTHMPLCEVRQLPDSETVNTVRTTFGGTSPNGTKDWLLWICPYLIASSPYKRTLWLDCDVVVLRNLGALFQLLDHGPVFTRENHDPDKTPNSPELYDLLPIDREFSIDWPLVNAGVTGWDLGRDRILLDLYQLVVGEAIRDVGVRNAISWHDQGSLIWALQKSGAGEHMLNAIEWNFCIKNSENYDKDYSNSDNILESLRDDYPDVFLLHWNGVRLPDKLLTRLAADADFRSITMNEFLRVKPAAGNGNLKKARPKIKLVSYLGVNSNLVMIKNFFDHYSRLGVEEYLIVLHAPSGNKQLAAVEQLMKSHKVVPWRIVDTFSAALKFERLDKMVAEETSDDDWILYADVDELQVYPDILAKFLEQCDEQGYSFVRGVFADRIAEDGKLVEMTPGASIWEQFPYVAPVTATISGGWDRKVCAAKGWRRVADGGSHALGYGVDGARNYRCTARDPSGHPQTINIHHFKWDATLKSRLHGKLNFLEGDLDAVDGKEFMHEYHRLKEHLDKNGRIQTERMERAGTPHLKFQQDSRIESED